MSTIKDFLKENLILPDIQREFVWNEERICRLFDSILRDYPIGNLLVWKLKGEDIKEKQIPFYSFLTSYSELEDIHNDKLTSAEPTATFYAILDGQQRTQSLIIGLKGYLRIKRYRAHKNNINAYEKNYLHLNIIGVPNEEDDYKYEFKFLTEDAAKEAKEKKWFMVSQVLNYKSLSDFHEEVLAKYELSTEEEKIAKNILTELYNKIIENNVIQFLTVSSDKDIEEVLDIFVRTNSGGIVLSKTDLLFSTIIADWSDAKEKIQTIVDKMNKKGKGIFFQFTKDFVMRSFLYLLDKPVVMKVNTFKENVKLFKEHWNELQDSLIKVSDVLKELGFNSENIISYNAIMPIVYFMYKNKNRAFSKEEKDEIRKYFVVSQLNKVFGGASNSTLERVREALKNQKQFSFSLFENVEGNNKGFKINDDILDSWFDYSKGEYTFLILTLLYPCAKIATEEFHQDHMHPESKLKETKWKQQRNLLANLQLLEGKENEQKSKQDLEYWLNHDVERKKNTLYLPKNVSYKIEDYGDFINERKKLMKAKLKEILK